MDRATRAAVNGPRDVQKLRTTDEIFAAGFEGGAKFPPLTDEQVNQMAALFAPVLNAPPEAKGRAA
jgi:hypothetical protein